MSLEEMYAAAQEGDDESLEQKDEENNVTGGDDDPFGSFNLNGQAMLDNRWTKCFDEHYQTDYYIDNLTGASQWEVPEEFVDDHDEDLIFSLYENLDQSGLVEAFKDGKEKGSEMLEPSKARTSSSLAEEDEEAFAMYETAASDNATALAPVVENRGKRNQDYIALAEQYKLERPFSDPKAERVPCLLCRKNFCTDVFFPCQHRCVCRSCIEKEKFCTESEMIDQPDGYCFCSLCAGSIRLILPSQGGAEEQQYWDWVYQDKVSMSRDFMKRFRHSAGVIDVVYVEENRRKRLGLPEEDSRCVVS